jgi:hypothetical protein
VTQHPNFGHPNMAIYDWLPAAFPHTLCSTGRLDLDVASAWHEDARAPLPPDIQMTTVLHSLSSAGILSPRGIFCSHHTALHLDGRAPWEGIILFGFRSSCQRPGTTDHGAQDTPPHFSFGDRFRDGHIAVWFNERV